MMRPRLTDRIDVWSTKVMQAEFTARMLYGDFLPFGAVQGSQWDEVLKLLTAKDAPFGALVRAVVLLEERASVIGEKTARERIRQLLQRMPSAPTRFSPEQKQAVLRWCRAVYGEGEEPSASALAEFRRTINDANLGWTRLLAMKHLEFWAGNMDEARRWDVQARQEANTLQRLLLAAFGIVVVFLLGGVLAWLVYAVWKSGSRSAQPAGAILSRRHVDTVLWGLVAYFAATYAGGWIAGLSARALPPSTPHLVVLVLLTQVATGGIALLILHQNMQRDGIDWRSIGLTWQPLPVHLLWGTGAYLATVPVLLMTIMLVQVLLPAIPSPAHPIAGVASAQNPAWVTALLFLVAAVFAPLFEEVFFRGILLNALWAHTGSKWVGIIGSALVFSVLHPQLYLGWIAVFVIGVMLGALFVERRSLLPCIWMHALNNTLALVAAQLLRIAG
ncbi:MAG: CPBP family intramembrane metalloprotease [Chthonomonadetes bacterium]|nr:CPBP family intramembrane metalloprotease [Chthonomonadetes bacterium]